MKSIERSTRHPVIMYNQSEGAVKTEDDKYAFVGHVFGTPSINANPEKVQELLQLFPRLTNKELQEAADGVYTWLLYSNAASDDIKFVCTEVVSPFEIGTRHQSLAYNSRIDAVKIYGGGELIKKGGNIEFNLLSGTYSKPLTQYNFDKSVTQEIIGGFKEFFPDAQYDNSRDSYIHKIKTVSNSLLDVYEKYGYTVRRFDSYNDWANFSNKFWAIDFNIEYYKKKVAEDSSNPIYMTLYMEALEGMVKILEKPKKGAARKTRRNKLRIKK